MAQTSPEQQQDDALQRRNKSETLARTIDNAAAAAFFRAGFRDPTLVLRWGEIVGPEIARIARPLRLSDSPNGATLTLKAEPAASLFLQHESRSLLQKINSYSGGSPITKLRFVQGPLAARTSLPPPARGGKPVPPGDPAAGYEGPAGLKKALLALAARRQR